RGNQPDYSAVLLYLVRRPLAAHFWSFVHSHRYVPAVRHCGNLAAAEGERPARLEASAETVCHKIRGGSRGKRSKTAQHVIPKQDDQAALTSAAFFIFASLTAARLRVRLSKVFYNCGTKCGFAMK